MMSRAAISASLAALGVLSLAGSVRAQGRPAGTVPLRVEVVAQEGATPLAYGVVSIPSQGLERFTDASGRVMLPVKPGRVLLRVKRLGFVPKDTTFEIATGAGQEVRVALVRVSFTLGAVRVVDWPPCLRPGIPRRGGDPQLRGIVGQLRQNAERYRLLTRTYPFVYEQQREFSQRAPDGTEEPQRTDTITVRGDITWRYRPGQLVVREQDGESLWKMRLPTISDLADDSFVENHCFHVAGLEQKGGQELLRVDVVAAQRLATPDVNVTVWLDPVGFQLRHSRFTLVRTRRFPHLRQVHSDVDYVEVVPFVPVMHETLTENVVQEAATSTSYLERQTIIRLIFVGARP